MQPWWHPIRSWLLVPRFVQVRWIRSRNRRHCARVGHKDALFHMAQEGEVPPDESVCYHCAAVLTECCNPGTCS